MDASWTVGRDGVGDEQSSQLHKDVYLVGVVEGFVSNLSQLLPSGGHRQLSGRKSTTITALQRASRATAIS